MNKFYIISLLIGTGYSLPYLKMYEDYQQKQSKEINTWDNIKTLIEKVPGLTQALGQLIIIVITILI